MEEDLETITKRNEESMKRIARLLVATKDLGINNLSELQKQGEQLQNINNDINKINQNMTVSERLLRKMESFNPFNTLWNKVEPAPVPVPIDINVIKNQINTIENNELIDDNILKSLNELKNIANDTTEELERQNIQLDNINADTNRAQDKIEKINRRCRNLLN